MVIFISVELMNYDGLQAEIWMIGESAMESLSVGNKILLTNLHLAEDVKDYGTP